MVAPKKPTRKPKTNQRRRPANKSKLQKAPLWAWVVIGCLVAALVTLLIFLANRSSNNTSSSDQVAQKPVVVNVEEPQPRFDFYEILKRREVDVPDRSGEIKSSTPDNIELYLQVASFRNLKDADELRANLLLLNLTATIEQVKNNDTQWHRVIAGPFESRSKMAKARSTLAEQKLKTLLIRRKVE